MEKAQLKTAELGETGLEITRVGFGAWAIGWEFGCGTWRPAAFGAGTRLPPFPPRRPSMAHTTPNQKKSSPLQEKPRLAGLFFERTTGIEPATLSLGS